MKPTQRLRRPSEARFKRASDPASASCNALLAFSRLARPTAFTAIVTPRCRPVSSGVRVSAQRAARALPVRAPSRRAPSLCIENPMICNKMIVLDVRRDVASSPRPGSRLARAQRPDGEPERVARARRGARGPRAAVRPARGPRTIRNAARSRICARPPVARAPVVAL